MYRRKDKRKDKPKDKPKDKRKDTHAQPIATITEIPTLLPRQTKTRHCSFHPFHPRTIGYGIATTTVPQH